MVCLADRQEYADQEEHLCAGVEDLLDPVVPYGIGVELRLEIGNERDEECDAEQEEYAGRRF